MRTLVGIGGRPLLAPACTLLVSFTVVGACFSAEDTSPRVTVERMEDGDTRIRMENRINTTITLQPPETRECRAAIAVTYYQRNTQARVTGTLDNSYCAASSGEYRIRISLRNDAGESSALDFIEPWQRGDNETIEFTRDYDIGENVDLSRVQARGLSCTCAEAPTTPEP
jgi:hypothetical protein